MSTGSYRRFETVQEQNTLPGVFQVNVPRLFPSSVATYQTARRNIALHLTLQIMGMLSLPVRPNQSPASETTQPSYMESGPPIAGSGLGDKDFSPSPFPPGRADRLKNLYTKLGRRTVSHGVIWV